MPVKKPGGRALGLNISMERQNSFNMSETGSFSQEQFTFGRNGITQSPISLGEVSNLRLDDLQLGRILGRGNSSRVYHAVHTPSNKAVAVKVLQEDLERSRESRHQVLNEVKTIFNAKSDHLVAFYDAFLHDGSIYLALEWAPAALAAAIP